MPTHNASNERIKRQYLTWLQAARGQSEATIQEVAKALARFEADISYRDFKGFHFEQARAFGRRLADQRSQQTGGRLSKATLHSTLRHLRNFFRWLADQPGYKSRLKHTDADYFSLSDNDSRIAAARRERPAPTLEQVKRVISAMPASNDIELRDRALIAFVLLCGARDGAIASMKIKHINVTDRSIYQDAREVRTKYRKSITTFFFPVGDDVRQIVIEWVAYLRTDKLCSLDDPLFPATVMEVGPDHQFRAVGLGKEHWRTAEPIRRIFREAFNAVGLPYFNPHSIRRTLVLLGESCCDRTEDFKAWSQNLGHEGVLTTFTAYGQIPVHRQGEIIRSLAHPANETADIVALAKEVLRKHS